MISRIALALSLSLAGVNAADITVSTNSDTGAGSLRQAIVDVASGGSIDFAVGLSGQTITLATEIVLSKGVTIDASSLSVGLTISGGNTDRLFNVDSSGDLVLRTLTLSGGNGVGAVSSGSGGAIYNSGTVSLERCTLSGNTATGNGGAILNALSATLTVTNSTLSGNTTSQNGGAIANYGTVTLDSATLSNNTATVSGGGIYSPVPASLTINNSIVAGNNPSSCLNIAGIWSGSHNITSGNAMLGLLINTGGTTQTMLPAPGSPAIDAGGATALTIDQRGLSRVLEVGLDIGACETSVDTLPTAITNDLTVIYNPTGLTIYGRLAAVNATGTFQISTKPGFEGNVGTYAGTVLPGPPLVGSPGFIDDALLSSKFNNPSGVAQDSLGNIFITDTANSRIRMIDAITGEVSTIAGSQIAGDSFGLANGPGPDARFAFPAALAVGPDDNVYVADTYNHRICKLTRPPSPGAPWTVSSLAGPATQGNAGFNNGSGSVALFNEPYGLTLDGLGNVYVADSANHSIRKITPSGVVSTYAGSATRGYFNNSIPVGQTVPTSARFHTPRAVAFYNNDVYVADTFNHCIRKIATNGLVTTIAGPIAPTPATPPALDPAGASGFLDSLTSSAARFNTPSGLASDGTGQLYVADENNHRIRKVLISDGAVTTIAGTGSAGFVNDLTQNTTPPIIPNTVQFRSPTGLLVTRDRPGVPYSGGNLVVADSSNHVLRNINLNPINVPYSVVPGSSGPGVLVYAVFDPVALGLNPDVPYFFRWASIPVNPQMSGYTSKTLRDFPDVTTVAASPIDPATAQLNASVNAKSSATTVKFEYSTDPDLLNPYEVSAFAGSGVAGDAEGTGAAARFSNPSGVVTDACGDVYVADRLNNRIRKITAAGVMTTFAGSGVAGFGNGTSAAAIFERPSGIAIDNNGNFYVADEYNHCIRLITPAGVVTTFAGVAQNAGFVDGVSAKFRFPRGVAVDSANNVYVADTGNHRIRRIDAITGAVTTLAGTGGAAFTDGAFASSQLSSPQSLAVTSDGKVLVADTGNHRIRMIEAGVVSTFAGSGNGFVDGAGASAQFSSPTGIALDALGVAYVTDEGNHRIRRIGTDGMVTTFAGSGIAGTVNSPAGSLYPITASQFDGPSGIGMDTAGSIYITQEGLVRKIARSATLPFVLGTTTPSGSSAVAVLANIPSSTLQYGSTYYFRAKGTNERGLTTGDILSFETKQREILVFNGSTVSDPAILHDQTAELDFGTTPRGQSVTRTFTISNPGSADLTVTSIGVPSGYQVVVPGAFAVPALGSATFQVRLTAAVGTVTYVGDVIINSDAHGQPVFSFPVTGRVLNPPVVTTDPLSDADITGTPPSLSGTATFYATINPEGSDTSVWFEWSVDQNFDGVYVTTVAGNGNGYTEGVGLAAKFNQPSSMVTDVNGNIYIADTLNHRIRKIDATTKQVTTFAGSGVAGYVNGAGAIAQFNEPVGLAINADGVLFVADSKNHIIRAVNALGEVSNYSGGGESITLSGCATTNGSTTVTCASTSAAVVGMYVSGTNIPVGTKITSITSPTAFVINTAATASGSGLSLNAVRIYGSFTNGDSAAARFHTPKGLTIDGNGVLYVADSVNHRIRKVGTDGSVSTLAGTGVAGYGIGAGAVATFTNPSGIAVDSFGSVYVTEPASHAIRKIEASGLTSVFAGSTIGYLDATGPLAQFNFPDGLVVDANDKLFVADRGNHRIRTIDQAGIVKTIAGNGSAATVDGYGDDPNVNPIPAVVLAQFSSPISIATTASGDVFVGESGGSAIRQISSLQVILQTGPVLSGTEDVSVQLVVNGLPTGLMTYFYRAIASNGGGTTTAIQRESVIVYQNPVVVTNPATELEPTTATLNATVDPKLSNTTVKFEYSTDPQLLNPYEVTALAGSDTPGYIDDAIPGNARFSNPSGVVKDSMGNIFVVDRANHVIRKIDAITEEVTTFAGTGVDAPFEFPSGIAIDSKDNLYVADEFNHQIRMITPAGVVSTFAGTGVASFLDGPKASAKFLYPRGVAVDALDNVYVADTDNHRIRKIAGIVTLLNCATTIASTTVTCSSTAGLIAGTAIYGPNILPGTTVASVTNSTSFVLSQAAVGTSTLTTFNAGAVLMLPNCTTTIASPNVTCINTSGLVVGMSVSGTNIAPGTTVSSVGATTFVLNQNATGTGAVSLNFVPVVLPNCVTTNSSAIVTCTSTTGMVAGMSVSGTNINPGTTIASVTNSTIFVLSQAATGTGPVNLSFIFVPPVLPNCITTISSTLVTCTSTTGMTPGMSVSGTNISPGTIITSVTNSTSFVINQVAVGSGAVNLNFNFVPVVLPNCDTTDTYTTVTSTSTSGLLVGMSVTGTNIAPGTTIVSIVPNTSFVLSQAAVGTGQVSLSFLQGVLPNCVTTNSSTTVTCLNTSGLYAGLSVSGTNIASGTIIASVTNSTTFEISQAAEGTGQVNLSFLRGALPNCATTSSSTTVTCLNTAGLLPGMSVVGRNIPLETIIASVTNATSFEISQAAEGTGQVNLSFVLGALPNCVTTLSTTVTCLSTSGMLPGMSVTGTNIAPGTIIASVTNSTSFVLSQAAVGAGAVSLSFNFVPVLLPNCVTTNLLTNVTCTSTLGLVAGMSVSGTNIAPGTTIDSVTNSTSFVLSQAAVGSGAVSLNFLPQLVLPNCVTTNLSTTVACTNTLGLAVGMSISGANIPSGTTIVSIVPNTSFVLSQAAEGTSTLPTINAGGMEVTTLAGTGVSGFTNGNFATSKFASPEALVVMSDGKVLVADTGNRRIRVIGAAGVSTLAGDGAEGFFDGPGADAQFASPTGITVDSSDVAYVTDAGNHRIRRIAADGVVTTLAGSGLPGNVNSPALPALHPATASRFDSPAGICIDDSDSLFVTQEGLVRKIARRAILPTLMLASETGSGPRSVSADIPVSTLRYGSTYYFRATGANGRSTTNGAILSFVTREAKILVFDGPSVSDPAILHNQAVDLDFGDTEKDQPVTRTFTISNPGTWPLNVTNVTVPLGYQRTGGVGVIAPLGSSTFTVTLSALSGSIYAGDIVIASDVHDIPDLPSGVSYFSIPITGHVFDPADVITLQESDTDIGTATFNATVNPRGSNTTVRFEWSIDQNFDGVFVSTLAGSGNGYTEGAKTVAKFNQPSGMVTDAAGNTYVADKLNHRIRKVAPDGTTTTFAGTGGAGFVDGTAIVAQFNEPVGLAMNGSGTLFVADSKNHRIRAIDPAGNVTTYCGTGVQDFNDGVAGAAEFNTPLGLAIDGDGVLYVADSANHRIRKVATNGSVSTLSGTGVAGYGIGAGTVATFTNPVGIAVDSSGSVYVTEAASHAIRKVAASGLTSVFAGVVGSSGVANYGIDPGTGAKVPVSGAAARFTNPVGLVVDADDQLYVADRGNNCIRIIDQSSNVITIAGIATAATVDGYGDIPNAINPLAPAVVLAQFTSPLSLATTVGGGVVVGQSGDSIIRMISEIQVLLEAPPVLSGTNPVPVTLTVTGLPTGLTTYFYRAIATNGGGTTLGNRLQNAIVYEYPVVVTDTATNLTPTSARLNATVDPKLSPTQVVFTYSTDPGLLNPYEVTAIAGAVTPGYFDNATPANARFSNPTGVVKDKTGNIFVADRANHRIRRIDAMTGAVTTFAGAGLDAPFEFPSGIAIDSKNNLYVADENNHCIRMITPLGVVSVFAGIVEDAGFVGGPKAAAKFVYPRGVAVDASDNVYVADTGNHGIRKIAGTVSLLNCVTTNLSTTVTCSSTAGLMVGTAIYSPNIPAGTTVASVTNSTSFVLSQAAVATSTSSTFTVGAAAVVLPNCDTTISSTTVTCFNTSGLLVGMSVTGTNIAPGTTVASVTNSTSFVLNQTAVGTGNVSLKFAEVVLSNCVTTISSPTVTCLNTSGLITGMSVTGTNIALGTTIVSVTNSTSFVLSQAATGSSAVTLNFLPPLVPNCVTTNASPTVTCYNTSGLVAGMSVIGTNIAPGTTIASITNSTSFVLSRNATGSGAVTLNVNLVPVLLSNCVTTNSSTTVTCFNTSGLVAGMSVTGTNIAPGTTIASVTNSTSFVLNQAAVGSAAVTLNFVPQLVLPNCVFTNASTTVTCTSTLGLGVGMSISGTNIAPGTTIVSIVPNTSFVLSQAAVGTSSLPTINAGGMVVTTLAGTGVSGFANGNFATSQFASPEALVVMGNDKILVADTGNQRIRMIDSGVVSTLAGSGAAGFLDGAGAMAQFASPTGITVDSSGVAYVTDALNHRIRRIATDGAVTTIAGSGIPGNVNSPLPALHPATECRFDKPAGICIDAAGSLFVTQDGLVRKVARSATLPTLTVSPLTTGSGPRSVFADTSLTLRYGTTYYYRATGTNDRGTTTGAILSFVTRETEILVFYGDSASDPAILHDQATAVDFNYAPTGQPLTRTFTITNPGTWPLNVTNVTVPAGYSLDTLGFPWVIAPLGSFTFEVTLSAITAQTYSGDIVITSDAHDVPDLLPGVLYFSFPITGDVFDPPVITTSAQTNVSSGAARFNAVVNPRNSSTTVWFEWSLDSEFDGVRVTTVAGSGNGFTEGVGVLAKFDQPSGLVTDAAGNIYVADKLNHRIRKIEPNGTTTTFAGTGAAGFANGPGGAAQFNEPVGLAMNASGTLFVADSKNHRIRAIDASGNVTTYCGNGVQQFNDGVAVAAEFNTPLGLAIQAGVLYVADSGNHRIRKIATDGVASTLSGPLIGAGDPGYANGLGINARFTNPVGVAIDSLGVVYVTEAASHAIRKVAPDGFTSDHVGSRTTAGFANAIGAAARFSNPVGLAVNAKDQLYVADSGNHRVRIVELDGYLDTAAGTGTVGTVDGFEHTPQYDPSQALGVIARLSSPISLTSGADGAVFFGEAGSSTIRKITSLQVVLQAATGLNGNANIPVQLAVTGLPPTGTTYFYRSFATNLGGTTIANGLASRVVTFRAWQLNNFGLNAFNPLISGPTASPSGDGVSNVLKYASGLNPLVRVTSPVPDVRFATGRIFLEYTKITSRTDAVYSVEWSTDLVNWSTVNIVNSQVDSNNTLGDNSFIRTRSSVAMSPEPAKFMRLVVTLQTVDH